MDAPPEIMERLYKSSLNSAPLAATRWSNMALARRDNPGHSLAIAGDVFLRPRMAMRYQLVPALDFLLSSYRPTEEAKSVKNQSDGSQLLRSIALLLRLYDPEWTELPFKWQILGNDIDGGSLDAARETLNDIFAESTVPDPLLLLSKFQEPPPDKKDWLRYYHLSDDELRAFDAEKAETIEKINKPDDEEENA